jgi:hypothetical protein
MALDDVGSTARLSVVSACSGCAAVKQVFAYSAVGRGRSRCRCRKVHLGSFRAYLHRHSPIYTTTLEIRRLRGVIV